MFAAVAFFENQGRLRSAKLVVLAFCVVATKSVTVTVLLGALWLTSIRRASWKLWTAITVFAVVIAALALGAIPFSRAEEVQQLLAGLLSLDSSRINYGSLYWRILVWHDSLQLMSGAGWTGYGLGSFADATGVGNLAHNVYVQLAVEAGYIGVTLYIVSLFGQARLLKSSAYAGQGLALLGIVVVAGLTLNILNYSAAIYALVVLLTALSVKPVRAQRSRTCMTGAGPASFGVR